MFKSKAAYLKTNMIDIPETCEKCELVEECKLPKKKEGGIQQLFTRRRHADCRLEILYKNAQNTAYEADIIHNTERMQTYANAAAELLLKIESIAKSTLITKK
jgi:hypothetical protein